MGVTLGNNNQGGLPRTGRLGLVQTGATVGTVESTLLGSATGTLASLGGANVRGSAIFATFTGGAAGERILFSASAIEAIVNNAATVDFNYFAALINLTTPAAPVVLQPLNLGLVPQDFTLRLPETATYRVAFGVLRNNPAANPFTATYSTQAAFFNVIGATAPEVDPAAAAVPLVFCAIALLLAQDRRLSHGTGRA